MTYEKMQQKLKGLRCVTEHDGLFYSTEHEGKLLTAEGMIEELSLLQKVPIIIKGDNGERFNAVNFILKAACRVGMREENK